MTYNIEKPHMKMFGATVRKQREYLGLSLEDMENRKRRISKSNMYLIECGRSSVSLLTLLKLCFSLQITPNELTKGYFDE